MKHNVMISGIEEVSYCKEVEMTDEQLQEWKGFVKRCGINGHLESGDLFDFPSDVMEGFGMESDSVDIIIDGKDCSEELLGE